MESKACTRRTIASGDYALVEQCSCGSIHLTIGAVTLRVSASALPSLAATVGDAARAVVLRGAFAPAAALDGVLS